MEDYLLLLLSGVLGLGLADTFFFKSLNLLGAGLSAIVDCLYSPSIIGLSLIFLGESLTVYQIIGVVLILSAVLTTTSVKGRASRSKSDLLWGLFWGASAMFTMAIGLVMIKQILETSPLLWVTEVRLLGGIITLFIVLLLNSKRSIILSSLYQVSSWRYTVSGSFLGAYLSMILWLAGMKYTQASTAAALNQTSNIFIFIFAAMFLKEPINLLRSIAIVLAVGGAFIVMFG